ncbi:MAG: Uma2 family endonuclease [Chloroflexia bacterium]
MANNGQPVELKLVPDADGLEVDMATLQGLWTEQQYLKVTDQTNHLIEFTDGVIEILPMPTQKHQAILQFLFLAILPRIKHIGGRVYFAPLRLRIREGKFREPDLLLVLDAHDTRQQNRFWLGADLVMEVVSSDNPERDTKVKRVDYAEAGIPEYWIVNPEDQTITVLKLEGGTYVEHAVAGRGETAISALLEGFAVGVADVLDAE